MNKIIILIVLPILIFALMVAMFCGFFDNHIKIACSIAQVALPPDGAKIINSGGWSTGFSNRSSFVFKASKEQIKQWIADSLSIEDDIPDELSEIHRLISFKSPEEMRTWEKNNPDKFLVIPALYMKEKSEMIPALSKAYSEIHLYIISTDPEWFTPNIHKGRFYQVYHGSAFIDDVNDMVWVTVSDD